MRGGLEALFYGVRQMTWRLRNEDHFVNEKRIRRLMLLMGLTIWSHDCPVRAFLSTKQI